MQIAPSCVSQPVQNRFHIDAVGGKIYWSDDTLDQINRCNLDGSSVETIVATAMDVDPERRYVTATDLARDIDSPESADRPMSNR